MVSATVGTTGKWLVGFLLCTSTIGYQDTFNYGLTNQVENSYGPSDWDQVECNDVATCPGWPTNWDSITDFIPYDQNFVNVCVDCENSNAGKCTKHQQSPIRLVRSVTAEKECNDRHKMRYWSGECRFNDMTFDVLPHTLRAYQPKKNCTGASQPQLDFSKGFPVPWILSHTDISVPSQHTMEGKRYDAEVVLTHTYSVDKDDRLIGNLAIMLEKGNRGDKYDFLELYIRGFLKTAKKSIRRCFPRDARRLSDELSTVLRSFDSETGNSTSNFRSLEVDYPLHDPRFQKDTTRPRLVSRKYYNRTWHPYDWYIKANTEYYYRYKGSLAEPPCIQVAHWRILKDPIRVSPSQLKKIEYLLKNRLDPETCEYHTAGVIDDKGRIHVNRPLQMKTKAHKLVYCECVDWYSKSKKDRAYCELDISLRGVFEFQG